MLTKLAIFNVVLFVLHAFSAFYIFWKRDDVSARFREIQIYETKIEPSVGQSEAPLKLREAFEVNLPILISVFFAITALFHFIYATTANGWYARTIADRVNPLRWIEYSITASIMVLILALSATIQELNQLVLLVVMTAAINLLGWVIELAVKRGDAYAAKLATFVAWVLQIAVFVVVAYAFVSTILAVNEKLSAEQQGRAIPEWVYAILIGELVFYASFGLVSGVMVWTMSKNFIRFEAAYHALSLFAKLFLGWLFFYGATQQDA